MSTKYSYPKKVLIHVQYIISMSISMYFSVVYKIRGYLYQSYCISASHCPESQEMVSKNCINNVKMTTKIIM